MNALIETLTTDRAQRIGWALVHFLWQGAAIAGLLWLALRLLARRSPQVRYGVACLGLLLMAAAPVITFFVVRPAAEDPGGPAQTPGAIYPEDDSWGKGTPLKVPTEFRDGTATLEQAKAWCRALVVGGCLGNGHVIQVEQRELVPGGERAVVVFDPSCGGSGGRGPQLIFSRTPKGLRFLGELSGSWRAVPPDALGRPRVVGYWRYGGGEGTASLIVLTSRGFVPVARTGASGDDSAADEQRRTWRTLFEEPVSQATLASTFGDSASSAAISPKDETDQPLVRGSTADAASPRPALTAGSASWLRRISAWAEPAMPFAVAVWLAGVLACSVWHVGGWLKVQRLRRGAAPLADGPNEHDWLVAAGRLADTLRIRRPVRLLKLAGSVARGLAGPVVVGVLRPAVLIPAAVVTGLAPAQIEAILAHELAHIRRHDYLANLLHAVVETLLFYHPAVWWVSARIRAEREHCCDDLAATAVGDGRSYAAALAALAELAVAEHAARPAGVLGRLAPAKRITPGAKTNLLSRIRRLLGAQASPSSRWTAALAGGLVLVALLAGVVFYGCANGPDSKHPQAVIIDQQYPAALEKLTDMLRQSLPKGYELHVSEGEFEPAGCPPGRGTALILQPVGDPKSNMPVRRAWIMEPGYDGGRSTQWTQPPGATIDETLRWRGRRVITDRWPRSYEVQWKEYLPGIHKAFRETDTPDIRPVAMPNVLTVGSARFDHRTGRLKCFLSSQYTKWRPASLSMAARVVSVTTFGGREIAVSTPFNLMDIQRGEVQQVWACLVLDPAEVGVPLRDVQQVRVEYRSLAADSLRDVNFGPVEPEKTYRVDDIPGLEVVISPVRLEGEMQFVRARLTLVRNEQDAEAARDQPSSHILQGRSGRIVSDDGQTRIETCDFLLNEPHSSGPPHLRVYVPNGLSVVRGTSRISLPRTPPPAHPAFGSKAKHLTRDEMLELLFAATGEKCEQQAAQRLIELGEPAIPLLVDTLGMDNHGIEVGNAQSILLRIGTPAVPALVQAMYDGVGRDGGVPAGLLGAIGDARAVEPLMRVMESDYPEGPARAYWSGFGGPHSAAARALGQLADRRAVPCLIKALSAPAQQVLEAAAWALGEIGDPAAIEALQRLPADKQFPVVREAIWNIRAFGPAQLAGETHADTMPVPAGPTPSGKVRMAFAAISLRLAALQERFPVLGENYARVSHNFKFADGATGVIDAAELHVTANVSSWSATDKPTPTDESQPACAIIVELRKASIHRQPPMPNERDYMIGQNPWKGFVKVWSNAPALVEAVTAIVDEELARATAQSGGAISLATQPATAAPSSAASPQWEKQTITFDGRTAVVEVQRFDPPLRIEPVALNKTSRATPLDTVVSMQSLIMLGKGREDFRRYAEHFSNPESFMRVRRQYSLDDWFAAVRRQQADMRVLGLIRYKEQVLVVFWMPSMEGTRGDRYVNAYNMVQRDGIWCADEDNKLQDPVIRHLHETNYAVVAQPTAAWAAESKPARREVRIVNWIELVDKDDLPAGMYCRVPVYRTTDHPGAKWVYQHTLRSLERGAGAEWLMSPELAARFSGTYTSKGTLEVAEQFVQGDTITIRLRYIDEDKQIDRFLEQGNPVHVYGSAAAKSVYLWGYMPKDLPAGRYTVNLELDEYIRQDGKLVFAPKDKIRHHERLNCTFTVPESDTQADTRPATAPAGDLLDRAEKALKAIQEAAKSDPTLGPLARGKIESRQQGDRWLALKADTPQVWDFPHKPGPPRSAHGWLSIQFSAERMEGWDAWTPFIPPPGCWAGHTVLLIPGTRAGLIISSATADPKAHRRLVELVIEQLARAGLDAKAEREEDAFIHPFDSQGQAPASHPATPQPASQPALQQFIHELNAAFDLTPQQQAKVQAWVEAGNLPQPPAVPNPAKLAGFLDSVLEGDQKAILRQLIESGKAPAQFAADRAAASQADTVPSSRPATQPVDAGDLAGPDNGQLPGGETTPNVAMEGQVTVVAICQAVGPARLTLGYSGAVHAIQTFRLLDGFYGQQKAGTTIDIRYSYLYLERGFRRSDRAIRADEKVIWILHHDGFGGERGAVAVADTAENRATSRRLVEQLPPDLAEKVEAARAEARMTDRLFAIKPQGWSGASMSQGRAQPMHWDAGQGMEFVWKTLEDRPEFKLGRAGQVTVWVMEAGYSGKRNEDAVRNAQAAPAQEIATWRGRRVFFWGGGDDWPTAKADIMAVLKATDAPAAETQPATQPASQPESVAWRVGVMRDHYTLNGLRYETDEDVAYAAKRAARG